MLGHLCCHLNVQVYVCDGTRVYKPHTHPELHALKQLGRGIVVLTDPDERGRDLRAYLDDLIGPLKHAFIAEEDCMSAVDGPIHKAGNRGVEHAVPDGIQHALSTAITSFGPCRKEWTLEQLQQLKLVNAFDAPDRGAATRRRMFCALLGLGDCTGAQLLSALNRYFTLERVQHELAAVQPL